MIARKCKSILIDGDQKLLMVKRKCNNVLVLKLKHISCVPSFGYFLRSWSRKILMSMLLLNLNLGHLQVNEKFYLC